MALWRNGGKTCLIPRRKKKLSFFSCQIARISYSRGMDSVTSNKNTSDNSESQEAKTSRINQPWSAHPYSTTMPLKFRNPVTKEEITSWELVVGCGETIMATVIAHSDGGQGYPRPKTREEAQEIANLIIAAPELLKALRPFAAYACDGPCNCFNCQARKAIAKAEGQT